MDAFKDRLPSAALALLLQALFIAAFLHAFSQAPLPRRDLAHEITFFLPRLPHTLPPAPRPIDATTPPMTGPLIVAPLPPDVTTAPPLSSQALQNLGQALSGCAPETYGNLMPEQRAHCVRPGEGMAIQQAPDPLNTRSHVKDEAYWQEQWTEAHWVPGPCPPWEQLVSCLIEQKHAEYLRAQAANALLASKKAAALKEPELPLPKRIGVHPQ